MAPLSNIYPSSITNSRGQLRIRTNVHKPLAQTPGPVGLEELVQLAKKSGASNERARIIQVLIELGQYDLVDKI